MGKVGEYKLISAGKDHAAAVDGDGTLWMWGSNWRCQLANGGLGNGVDSYGAMMQTAPIEVLDNVVSVSCGQEYTATIQSDGSLWTWGYNGDGQLGNDGVTDSMYGPIQTTPVKMLDDVAVVNCGSRHAAAIQTDGSLWTWGYNGGGQLGNGGVGNAKSEYGNEPTQTVPVKVMDNVVAVSCEENYTAAIQTDGSLWMWGDNVSGKRENGENATVPVKIMDDVAAVSCGSMHTAVIKTDGSLWILQGVIPDESGKGTEGTSTKVLDNVVSVSCGYNHTAAIQADGSLWTWGQNDFGGLGNGTTEYSGDPIKVMDNVAAVSCGDDYTMATQVDGSLWTWGYNWRGQLGYEGGNDTTYGDQPIQTVPRQVEGIISIRSEEPVTAHGDSTEAAADAPSTEGESGKSPEKADATAPAQKEEKEDGGFPVLPVVLGVGGVAAVAVVALLVIKKKRP